MELVDREVKVAVFAPGNVAHVVDIKLLELLLVKVAILLRMRVCRNPRTEVDGYYCSIVKG